VMLAKRKRLPEAIDAFRRALELDPNLTAAYGNLGLAFLESGQVEEAASHLRKCITLGGGSAGVHNNLGVALVELSEPASAVDSFLAALHVQPDYAAGHYNLARALLVQGQFEQGWLEFEWRDKCIEKPLADLKRPRWLGQPVKKQTILLRAESDAAETIQFLR